MIEQDTVKLLRECDAGIRMGVSSIDDVLPSVRSHALERILVDGKQEHERLGDEVRRELDRFGDSGKMPSVMASSMSHMKTTMELAMDRSDARVADLMTDGCSMGVKSLSRYLNQYAAASEKSKDIAKRLIAIEEKLGKQLRGWL